MLNEIRIKIKLSQGADTVHYVILAYCRLGLHDIINIHGLES